ncbi:MAG: hypothetical protein H7301_00425 [Cryobacterium sp.]|nr:hypothetical protein [Oligoflexia bacterium]
MEEARLIAGTAKRIGDFIEGLRAFAREGDKDPFLFTSIDSIIQDALVLCESRFKTYGVSLEVSRIPAGLQIECRAVQITQFILNLITNNFDAVTLLTSKWIKVDVSETPNDVIIAARDAGSGVSEAILSKLFQLFFTTKEVGKRTGLGQSISRGIINDHGGSLEYDATSLNTVFLFKLPKSQTNHLKRKP